MAYLQQKYRRRANVASAAKAWRDNRRQLGLDLGSGPSGASGKYKSAFVKAEFVAVDGEGFTEGPFIETPVSDGNVYRWRRHYYAMLKASDGSEINAPQGRLETVDCLEFLLNIKRRNPNAVLVCFGGSYDVCQMVAHDLTRDQLCALFGDPRMPKEDRPKRQYLDITYGDTDYRLDVRPRKSFTISAWPKGSPKSVMRKGKWHKTPCETVTLWDVWGFFQGSFVRLLKDWLPHDHRAKMITEMKAKRQDFQRKEWHTIRAYTDAELDCLVKVMDDLREALQELGLTLMRWDGAGAVAGAMMRKHRVKDHMQQSPPAVFEAARCAYSGGHIEMCQVGKHNGTVYHYDINSAYPSVFADLPSLKSGAWVHGDTANPPPGFTLVRVRWRFRDGLPFYPLFYRQSDGSIIYPRDGEGWYWFPEYYQAHEYARDWGAEQFEIVEWWHMKPATDDKPFSWVRDYYARRQQLVAISKATGVPNGEQMIIKLGLNSLYGKTAQQVGFTIGEDGVKPPSYFQLEWAGYVTAGCRAKLMEAARQNPLAIIAFATDGLFSTAPLDLHCPDEKVLGAWEAQTHTGITAVMPGVYWLHDDDKVTHYSRGFDKEQMSSDAAVIEGWHKGFNIMRVSLSRLIGVTTALTSDALWPMRGTFAQSDRTLSLAGNNSKRLPINVKAGKPHTRLVPTRPRDRWQRSALDALEGVPLSEPYPIAWLDDVAPIDETGEREEELEMQDADLA